MDIGKGMVMISTKGSVQLYMLIEKSSAFNRTVPAMSRKFGNRILYGMQLVRLLLMPVFNSTNLENGSALG